MKRKIFILEDSPTRIKYFKERLGLIADLHIYSNVKDASTDFNPPYDAIFLDHDLEGEYNSTALENTGSGFCRWLSTQEINKDQFIIVHSHNQHGADYMKEILVYNGFTNVKIAPFYFLLELWDRNKEDPFTFGYEYGLYDQMRDKLNVIETL